MNFVELKIIKERALKDKIPIIMDETLNAIEKELNNIKLNRILEIGTAVGYSAINFTNFLDSSGKIDTIEREEDREHWFS